MSINVNQFREMVHRLAITKARINLGQIVRRAHVNKEYFILEKDGIPVIGILDAEELEDYLELRDPGVREQIARSNADIVSGRTRSAAALFTAKPKRPSKR